MEETFIEPAKLESLVRTRGSTGPASWATLSSLSSAARGRTPALPPRRRGGYDASIESVSVRSRRLLGRLHLPCAVAIGTLGLCGAASAAGLPSLAVHRTEDSADCPDADALAAAVAQQMKRPALDPGASGRGLDVQIYRSEAGYTAVIQAGGKTRQLSDRGPTCEGLAAALAVSIAVMLDAEPLPPE